MALRANSLFLYNFQVTETNRFLSFKVVSGGLTLTATMNLGYYSLSSLLIELNRAMVEVAPSAAFIMTVDRTVNSGTENRVTIGTAGSFLELYFFSGNPSNPGTLLGFDTSFDRTGSTSYQGEDTAGTALITEYQFGGFNYLGPDFYRKVFGSVNVSASGVKEAIVFQIQRFWQVQFKYEPQAKVISEWQPFFTWAIQQRPLEFTPEISSPTIFYEGTLEKTTEDGHGLGYKMTEMLPEFPFSYDTGLLLFRQTNT